MFRRLYGWGFQPARLPASVLRAPPRLDALPVRVSPALRLGISTRIGLTGASTLRRPAPPCFAGSTAGDFNPRVPCLSVTYSCSLHPTVVFFGYKIVSFAPAPPCFLPLLHRVLCPRSTVFSAPAQPCFFGNIIVFSGNIIVFFGNKFVSFAPAPPCFLPPLHRVLCPRSTVFSAPAQPCFSGNIIVFSGNIIVFFGPIYTHGGTPSGHVHPAWHVHEGLPLPKILPPYRGICILGLQPRPGLPPPGNPLGLPPILCGCIDSERPAPLLWVTFAQR